MENQVLGWAGDAEGQHLLMLQERTPVIFLSVSSLQNQNVFKLLTGENVPSRKKVLS